MSEECKKANILKSCVGKGQDLSDLVDYADNSIVSKTVLDKSAGTITLFAFDVGQGLSEHTAPYDAVVVVLDGSAKLTIGGDEVTACAGQIVIMPANVPHSVAAQERFKMLLVMIKH